MLSWFAGRMLGTPLKDGLVWLVSSLLLCASPRFSQVFESPMLPMTERLSIWPSPFPSRTCPARVLVGKAQQRGNRGRVKRQLRSRSSFNLGLAMSRLCYPRDVEFILMTQVLQLPWKTKMKTVSSRRSCRSRRAAPDFQSSPRKLNISLVFLQLYCSIYSI